MSKQDNENYTIRDKIKMANEEYLNKIEKAIVTWHHADEIKSKLIMLSQFIHLVRELEGEQREGAKRLIMVFFNTLVSEMGIGFYLLGSEDLERARTKVKEAVGRVQLQEYRAAELCITEAISFITNSSQRAMELLIEEGLMSKKPIVT